MPTIINTEEFLGRAKSLPIIDVRSPGEYDKAHIPGAFNLPLFNDEERAVVGTYYKQRGRVPAVQKGLEFVGPKLKEFTKFVLKLDSPEVLVHCWRGGMRSSAMAWLLETVDIKCTLLRGGYKAYRNFVLDSLAKDYRFILLGGCTGSGKTELIDLLIKAGEQAIDLEGLANHKGSAFGAIGQEPQPSSEYFENKLSEELLKLDPTKPIWLEDESRNIGKVNIPQAFWDNMRTSPLVVVDIPHEVRLERLLRDYAVFPAEKLAESIKKIEKRLGYDKCKFALDACLAGDTRTAASICLEYYDKAYNNQLETRYGERLKSMPRISSSTLDNSITLEDLIHYGREKY